MSKAKSQKQRSQEYRQRKSAYITTLETQISTLKSENSSLKSQISSLKAKIPLITPSNPKTTSVHSQNSKNSFKSQSKSLQSKFSHSNPPFTPFKHKLHEYEDYVYNIIPKKISQNPATVRFSEIDQTYDHVEDFRYENHSQNYNYSKERVQFIKQKFTGKSENYL